MAQFERSCLYALCLTCRQKSQWFAIICHTVAKDTDKDINADLKISIFG